MIDSVPRPDSGSPLTRVVAAVAVATVVSGLAAVSITSAAGAGGGNPDKTIPSVPATDAGATDVPGITDVTAPESSVPLTTAEPSSSDVPTTSVEIDTGIDLSPNAEITEMFALSDRLIGRPSSDVAASLSAFAVIPDGIPSPVDSTIQDFSIDYYGESGYFYATATFTSSAVPADVVVFYETMLTAAGFTLSVDDVQSDPDSGRDTHALEFSIPESGYDGASIRVQVETDDDPVITIAITDTVGPDTLEAFGGWARGMPAVSDGMPIRANLSASRDLNLLMTVSTEYLYEDRTPEELTAEIRDDLADGAGGFNIDPERDEGGSVITMAHTVIVDPVAEVSGADSQGATMLITGSLQF